MATEPKASASNAASTLSLPTAASSATGNPRNKCALKPGHSLMDWIRLGNSGKDLTGVGGRMRPVTYKELVQHNTKDDAWISIRGRVYNITHYFDYHPGGIDELMRGVGTEATRLFDQVHPWVNYESLLSKCLIGPLRNELPASITETKSLVKRSVQTIAEKINSNKKKETSKIIASLIKSTELPLSISRPTLSDNVSLHPIPRLDWIQTSEHLSIVFYTGSFTNPGAVVTILDSIIKIRIDVEELSSFIEVTPESNVENKFKLKVYAESGKIELNIGKVKSERWSDIGKVVIGGWTQRGRASCMLKVACIEKLTRDVSLISLDCDAKICMPVGAHLKIYLDIEGDMVSRPYTPLTGWYDEYPVSLAIKSYHNGLMSPRLTTLNCDNSVLKITQPYSTFKLKKLKNVTHLYLLAAGTGITPMLCLIVYMLQRRLPKCELVKLLFFNKTTEDIMFNDRLHQLAKNDERFQIENILSEPDTSWTGRTGRVCNEHITQCIGSDKLNCEDDCDHFVCICGPSEFTKTCCELLSNNGLNDGCIHSFLG